MKIGIVSQSYYPRFGGVTENVHNTATELARRGHRVTVITSRFPGQDTATRTPEGVEIVRIGRNVLIPYNGAFVDFTIGTRLRTQLARAFAAQQFDVVHVHNPAAPSLPLLALTEARSALVGTFHMTGSNRLQSMLRSPLEARIARLDRRIAVSPTAADCAREVFPGHYDVVPNGIDIDRFRPDIEPIETWRRDSRLNLLFVGRLDPRKGLPDLLRAMPAIVSGSASGVRLLVVGHSRLRARMEAMVPAAVRAHVHFVGAVPAADLPRWYATADIFVSPATGNESFGIVLLEAMAAGRPVVCSDLPGYRNAVVPDESALVHRPGDPDDIARAVLRLVDDAPRRRKIGAAGRRRALEFAWPRVTDAIERVYTAARGAVAHESHVVTPRLV
jgi:phosphatidylinositol alpha-mannosyltransferase